MKKLRKISQLLIMFVILSTLVSAQDRNRIITYTLSSKDFEISEDYDLNNALHLKKQDILHSPAKIIKGISIYSGKQYDDLISLDSKLSTESLIALTNKDTSLGLTKEEINKEINALSKGVFSYFGYEKDVYYGDRLPTEAQEETLRSVCKALSYLTEKELELIKGASIFVSSKEVLENEDGIRYEIYGTASRRGTETSVTISPVNDYYGYEDEYSKSVIRTTLHEIGHLINYKLEDKYGDEFWSLVEEAEPLYSSNDESYSGSKWEDFTETFVVGKIRTHKLDLINNEKKGKYEFNEDLLNFITEAVNN